MKYRTLAISFLFFLFPFGELSASEPTFNSQNKVLEKKYLNTVAFNFNKKKTAEEYLDQAQQIIGDYSSILRENKKERREVVRLVKKSLKLKETARAYLYLGHVDFMAFNSHGYKEGVKNYKKAIKLNPEYPEAFIALGTLHQNNDNYEDTISNFKKAISLNAENEFLYALIGEARQQMGDHKGAIVALKKAMKFNPNKAIIYIHSGQSKHFLGDYQGSISDYSKAIKLKPEAGYSYYLRAFAYFSQKDSTNGCKNLKDASKYGFNTSKEIEKYCQKLVLRDGYKNLRYSS